MQRPPAAAGWAGLIINAINCLPAGELDGGRVFLGLCGRRAASRMGAGAGGAGPGAGPLHAAFRWCCHSARGARPALGHLPETPDRSICCWPALPTPPLPPRPSPLAVTLLLLGLFGFTNSLSLFWLLLLLTLQRGPVTPCDEELSPIADAGVRAAAIAALLLPLLVLLPYPAAISFSGGGVPGVPAAF